MPAANQIFEPVKIDHCCHTVNCITTMVSFEDIRNMRLHYADSQKTIEMRVTVDLITLWVFSICYLISINASKAFTSILSLLGMYYATGDMVTYYYTNYILKRNDVNDLNQESDEVHHEPESDGNTTVNDGAIETNDEVDDDIDDECEVAPDMITSLFRKTTNSEDENEQRNKKSLQQLREFEEKIREKNLGVDDYSDLPPLVKLESVDWNPANLLSYMNPSLRQPGQYAPSINEGDE